MEASFILFILCLLILIELLVLGTVLVLKREFPWIITKSDIKPIISDEKASKFFANSFHERYGWLRPADVKFNDISEGKEIIYSIDSKGRRSNPINSELKPDVAIFGDSFAFGRLVDDHSTISAFLSRLTHSHVTNYGFGNYGFDQALLRLSDEIDTLEEKYIVMCVVPETIARIQSIWKHYFEYGNILAFKPRYILTGGRLILEKNRIKTKNDLINYESTYPNLQHLDPFFRRKFRKDILHFPFCFHLIFRANRHLPILFHLLFRGRKTGTKGWTDAFRVVLKQNANWTSKLYSETNSTKLLSHLINKFSILCKRADKIPILLVVPQEFDLGKTKHQNYSNFFAGDDFKGLTIIDAGSVVREIGIDNAYVNGTLGPHPSPELNSKLAKMISQKISG